MSKDRVVVSYSAPQSFLASDNWSKIHTALISQLPLRNIHWKSAFRPSLRTIQELDVAFVALDSLQDEHASQIPVTVLEKPLLSMYIVFLEDTDFEAYRNTVKKQIKDWISGITAKKNHEWLILHVVRPDSRTPSGNFFQMKYSVFDRIKTDFNTEKRDRCVQLTWSTYYDNPAAWAELINRLKDGILSAFDAALTQREEEVRRSESQRQMPGWNFCTYFILKESVASSFEGVNLYEDALHQYMDLEASFQQVLKERNVSWFGSLIQPGPKDDSLPLLSITNKPYRDLILANTISVFDFRTYLLARQCHLLAKLERISEVGKKVASFLNAFARRLHDVKATIPEFFIQSWIYSSSLSVVEQCDQWLSGLSLTGSALAAAHASKGGLLEMARHQLDMTGVVLEYLPAAPPFAMDQVDIVPQSQQDMTQITNSDLVAAISDKDFFYDLYVDITNRAIDMYAKSGRRKCALKLHGCLAAIDLHRNRLDEALTTFNSLPAHYAPHLWHSLEAYMLSRAVDAHLMLTSSQTREWVHILLAFLKAYSEGANDELLVHHGDTNQYITRLVEALTAASQQLESELLCSEHPAIHLAILGEGRLAGDRDGAYIDVSLSNGLCCPLIADEISIFLVGPEEIRHQFTVTSVDIRPGKTSVSLFSPTSTPGAFLVDSQELRLNKLLFQWAKKSSHRNKDVRFSMDLPRLVHLPVDYDALSVQVSQPRKIKLGESPSLQLAVNSGRNDIIKLNVTLSTPSGAAFRCKDTQVEGSHALELFDNALEFSDLSNSSEVILRIPHSDTSATEALRIIIVAQYTTRAEPAIARKVRFIGTVATSLPLAINVEDFFRGQRLFSKFTISTTSLQCVRISSAHLQFAEEHNNRIKIFGCAKRRIVDVTPNQPASFLFHIDSLDGPVRDTIYLTITYRLLRKEIDLLVQRAIDSAASDSATKEDNSSLMDHILSSLKAVDSSWIEPYCVTGQLRLPDNHSDEGFRPGTNYERVKELLSDSANTAEYLASQPWHEVRIPLDVPLMNVIASADIQLKSHSGLRMASFYAGQPIPTVLTIHTSFYWSDAAKEANTEYLLRFDVEEMTRDWLVSGQKRGDFIARDDDSYSVALTLVALHHGELQLPKVSLQTLPIPGQHSLMSMPSIDVHQVHGAERVLILPRGGRSTFVVDMDSI